MGCDMTVAVEAGAAKEVSGNQCARGVEYARREIANPVRAVSTTVRLRGADVAAAPVKAAVPVPRDRAADWVRALKGVEVDAPVTAGQVVVADVGGSGVAAVATRTIQKLSTVDSNASVSPASDGL